MDYGDPVHGYPRGFLEVGPYRPANSLWVSAWQIHRGGLYTTYASGLNAFRPKMCHGEGHTYAEKMKLMHGFPFSRQGKSACSALTCPRNPPEWPAASTSTLLIKREFGGDVTLLAGICHCRQKRHSPCLTQKTILWRRTGSLRSSSLRYTHRSTVHPTSSAEARPVYGREEADPVFRPA